MDGRVTVAMNIYKDLCYLQKPGGAPLQPDFILKLVEAASIKAGQITKLIRDALLASTSQLIDKAKAEHVVPMKKVFLTKDTAAVAVQHMEEEESGEEEKAN